MLSSPSLRIPEGPVNTPRAHGAPRISLRFLSFPSRGAAWGLGSAGSGDRDLITRESQQGWGLGQPPLGMEKLSRQPLHQGLQLYLLWDRDQG